MVTKQEAKFKRRGMQWQGLNKVVKIVLKSSKNRWAYNSSTYSQDIMTNWNTKHTNSAFRQKSIRTQDLATFSNSGKCQKERNQIQRREEKTRSPHIKCHTAARTLTQVPQRLCAEMCCSLDTAAHTGLFKNPWAVLKGSVPTTPLPHRFAHGTISPCCLTQCILLFPISPSSVPSCIPVLFQHNKEAMTHFNRAPRHCCLPWKWRRSEMVPMQTHLYWMDFAMAGCLDQRFG